MMNIFSPILSNRYRNSKVASIAAFFICGAASAQVVTSESILGSIFDISSNQSNTIGEIRKYIPYISEMECSEITSSFLNCQANDDGIALLQSLKIRVNHTVDSRYKYAITLVYILNLDHAITLPNLLSTNIWKPGKESYDIKHDNSKSKMCEINLERHIAEDGSKILLKSLALKVGQTCSGKIKQMIFTIFALSTK